jgi:alpha,alpha-trehalase
MKGDAPVQLSFITMKSSSSTLPPASASSQERAGLVKKYIHDNWPATIRTATGEYGLPRPFTVPSPDGHEMFNLFYYWDTYFTSLGLALDGNHEQACDNAENMMYEIETYGFVPNYNRLDGINRSQPPFAALQIELCLPFRKDTAWRQRAYAALEQEYAFWMAGRRLACGLNCYRSHGSPKDFEGCGNAVESRMPTMPDRGDPAVRLVFASNALAIAESGWDFTPRWATDYCQDSAAVDLNSLLFSLERVQADLAEKLENGRAGVWRERMKTRQALMVRLLWDEDRGLFVDYSEASGKRSTIISAASYFPLFCGMANSKQAERSAYALAALETEFGLDTCVPGERPQHYQWDSPNMWPPLVWVAVSGLRQIGEEARGRTLARKYVETVVRNFETTGQLWEKYNALTGQLGGSEEYAMPPMLGWTAGVFLACCEVAGV